MTSREKVEILEKCFQNICKNFDVLANLSISDPLWERGHPSILTSFLDIRAGCSVSFHEQEIVKQFLENGISSRKEYRKFRALVRWKLINALRELHDLTGEGLRNLGALPQ